MIKRFNRAKQRKLTTWYSHMRECYEYAIPNRETFFEHTPGEKKNTKVFDPTAVSGVSRFANRVQKAVCPAGVKWAVFVPGDDVDGDEMINYNGEEITVSEALERITDTVFGYLHRSNFDNRLHEGCLDLAVSTGLLTCDYDPKTDDLVFDAVPLSDVYLESGPRGTIDGHWREHREMSYKQLMRTWPGITLPDDMKEAYSRDEFAKVGPVIEGMLYDHDASEWFMVILCGEKSVEVYREYYGDSSPWIPFRWTVVPGEVYGRGPLMQVLPDIKTLNAMSENALKSAALSVMGVWTGVADGIFNPFTFRVAPGVVIPVSSNGDSNPSLRRLDVGGEPVIHDREYERRVDAVNRALFANPIGSIDDPTKTATEITIRRQIDLEDAGASFGRLMTELAGGTIRRVLHVLGAEGIIPKLVIDGKNIALKYTSPIARLGDTEDVQNLTHAMQSITAMGIPPEVVMGTVNIDEVPEYVFEKLGVSPTLVKDEQERQEMGKKMGALASQQMGGDGEQAVQPAAVPAEVGGGG